MIDPKVLDDLARTLADSVPPGLRELRRDMEKNARAALEGAFARLNLVSREEFEIQAGVLARTRAKLETLEKHLAELEAELSKKGGKKK
ncbi:MAG: accessory factor UbiK family protein [Gammaproteobacteria bacterium]